MGKLDDDFCIGYSELLSGDYIFKGEDFDWFYTLEKTTFRCEYIYISVSRYCDGEYIADWKTAKLTLNSGNWDLDTCKVSFKPETEDKYACFTDNKDSKLNLLSTVVGDDRGTVTLSGGTLEYYECTKTYPGPVEDPEPCPQPSGNEWTLYYVKIISDDSGRTEEYKYARLNMGDGTYQPAVVYNPVISADPSGHGSQEVWSVAGADGSINSIDNGMKLRVCFQSFLDSFCSDLTLKSNFFQWNPDTETTTNYVTGVLSKVLNLFLFQKTDVRTPDVSANATVADISFADLIKNICTAYNLRWDIIDNFFQIEHLSFWNKEQGLDLTIPRYAKNILYSKKYTYATEEMKKFETFKFMEAQGIDFVGDDIYYESACVDNTTSDDNKKLFEANLITTDIAFVLAHPDTANDDTISNDGFCLVACNTDNNIITEAPVLDSVARLNNSLAWAQLQRDYYQYGRILLHGYMNRMSATFLSSIPTKKQVKLLIPLCCADEFDPFDLVTTQLSTDGNVDSATFDMSSETLELNLLFNAETGLIGDDGPVANNDTATTPVNTPVIIEILANDTDAGGTIDPTTVIIVNGGGYGTTIVNLDGTITYTPNTDYQGFDTLLYTVKDNWGVVSNIGSVSVAVGDTDPPPESDAHWGSTEVISEDALTDYEQTSLIGEAGEVVNIEVSNYINTNGGAITFNGVTVTGIGQTFSFTLDGSGLSALIDVHLDGVTNPGTILLAQFTILDTTGSPVAYQINRTL